MGVLKLPFDIRVTPSRSVEIGVIMLDFTKNTTKANEIRKKAKNTAIERRMMALIFLLTVFWGDPMWTNATVLPSNDLTEVAVS